MNESKNESLNEWIDRWITFCINSSHWVYGAIKFFKILDLKVGLPPFKKNFFIYFNESLLKTTKNTFYFMLKAHFVVEIFTFLSWLFGYAEKRLDNKALVISKFMTSEIGQQIIIIHKLPNISRSKDNRAMKFGQVIKYNTRNIFLEKLYTKYDRKASPRPFCIKSNWEYLWINSLKC